jgi:ADP-dependent NAD(P)H-hydrate dehydratase
MPRTSQNKILLINSPLLKSWALPGLDEGGDKELRGRVLIIAGCAEMPGAAALAATSALRAGAGKLQVAAPSSAAPWIALAVPEALVLSLPETKGQLSSAKALKVLRDRVKLANAVLIGPGMMAGPSLKKLIQTLLPLLKGKTLILDAEALHAAKSLQLQKDLRRFEIQTIITPHAGEMAKITGLEKEQIQSQPQKIAQEFAARSGIVTVLKGAETFIAEPSGSVYKNTAGNAGLGVSGSGDTLAGIIAGLAARGSTAVQAAVWGVYLHASAGDILADRLGPLGYLPREIPIEIPGLMKRFSPKQKT